MYNSTHKAKPLGHSLLGALGHAGIDDERRQTDGSGRDHHVKEVVNACN